MNIGSSAHEHGFVGAWTLVSSCVYMRWPRTSRIIFLQHRFPILSPKSEITEVCQPVADIEKCAGFGELVARGHVPVRKNEEVNVGVLQQLPSKLHLELLLTVKTQHAIIVRVATAFGKEPGNGECLTRVQHAVQSLVEWTVEDALDEQIAALLATQTVAVTDKTAFPVNGHQLRLMIDFRSKGLCEIVFHPHVVIARKIVNLNTLAIKFFEIGKQGDISFGDHVAIFEPKIENVAQQEKMLDTRLQTGQQLNELLLALLAGNIRRRAEMRVRHEHAMSVQLLYLLAIDIIFHVAKIVF